MNECLLHPTYGYYMNRDVFGRSGDFVTSPEVSQLFGEMVGIFCVSTWLQMGRPPKFQLVELGPGRGTLMRDVLKTVSSFPAMRKAASVHLVEASTFLKTVQQQTLGVMLHPGSAAVETVESTASPNQLSKNSAGTGAKEAAASVESTMAAMQTALAPQPPLLFGSRADGTSVSWHARLRDVPAKIPTIVLANELFDALPVHQFQLTEKGWCERLVDLDSGDGPHHLRLVMSPGRTPASTVFVRSSPASKIGDAIEVCPSGLALAQDLAARVASDNGAALIIDYGQYGPYSASLQAIRKHEFVDIFDQPGTADLSAYVDFRAIGDVVRRTGHGAVFHGPVTQSEFLHQLGIDARLHALLDPRFGRSTTDAEALTSGYNRLTSPAQMGERFKVCAISHPSLGTLQGLLPPAAPEQKTG
eukprot:TRINITY_DN7380_c0_g1_i1.p1 TRINITY_DN7380_c0_g1~~TRINITY_DN7380_c0_g1_i1.p1  ORF type:complete len:452 (-),score=85.89 TRINITY_DN7380_c0_g1_i1:10-1260(-)